VEITELNQVPYYITFLFGVHFAWQLLNTETSQRARLVNNVTVPAIVWQAVKTGEYHVTKFNHKSVRIV